MRQVRVNGFMRISKQAAITRFKDGKNIILCPCKVIPGGPFARHVTIYGDRLDERMPEWKFPLPVNQGPLQMALHFAESFPQVWQDMINDWSYYNASNEEGTYPAFYILESDLTNGQ